MTGSLLVCIGSALLLAVAAIASIIAYEREVDEMIAALDRAQKENNDD